MSELQRVIDHILSKESNYTNPEAMLAAEVLSDSTDDVLAKWLSNTAEINALADGEKRNNLLMNNALLLQTAAENYFANGWPDVWKEQQAMPGYDDLDNEAA